MPRDPPDDTPEGVPAAGRARTTLPGLQAGGHDGPEGALPQSLEEHLAVYRSPRHSRHRRRRTLDRLHDSEIWTLVSFRTPHGVMDDVGGKFLLDLGEGRW